MSPAKHQILETACAALQAVPNVLAIVLGGSYASGMAGESSDLDIGLYYREAAPLDVDAVRAAAASICTPASVPVVTGLYGWGPWVNGGAWIQTPVTKVDLLYRNLDQVERVIAEGRRGIWRHDYDQQPPYGFRSVIYFAETHCCVPLYDPAGAIAALKESVAVYPEALKSTIVQESLWGAEFSLWSCGNFAGAADTYNAAGCLTRAAQFLVHALFAINEEYFLNDKHVPRMLAAFPQVPLDCADRLAAALAAPGRHAPALNAARDVLRRLLAETVALTKGAYQPRFDMAVARNQATSPSASPDTP